jgi:RNA polymerase sigma-70 factor (ECF subfamily)
MITSQFLQSCQSGDPEAIQTLVRGHQRAVFQLALSVIDDGAAGGGLTSRAMEQAEIATRETFVRAVDRLGSYREDTPFEPWLYGIAVQVSRRRYRIWRLLRALRRWLGRALDETQGIYTTESERIAPTPADAELWSKVRALPEGLRLPMVLRYYHDMSIADIAHILRTREGAIHARLDAARERITSEKMEE